MKEEFSPLSFLSSSIPPEKINLKFSQKSYIIYIESERERSFKMINLIDKIYRILNACKGFMVGYSSDTFSDGYFYIEYEGKAYAVKVAEMPMKENESSSSRVGKVQYYI